MLGSLARWLRISGYDTEYRKNSSDDELIDEAKKDNRILISRDEVLIKRAIKLDVKAIFLRSDSDEKNLRHVADELELVYDPQNSRCPLCNGQLFSVDKEKIRDRVPLGTFRIIEEYWECGICGGIYWRGSHWRRIVDTLNSVL